MDTTIQSSSGPPLSGKTAVITGASSGIGRATALTLAAAGAAVVIQARRKDRPERVAREVAESICWLLSLPHHVNINEIMIRPTGQVYP